MILVAVVGGDMITKNVAEKMIQIMATNRLVMLWVQYGCEFAINVDGYGQT